MAITNIGTLQAAAESWTERTFDDSLFLEWANAVSDKLNRGVMGADGRNWLVPPVRIPSMLTATTLATSGGQATVPAAVLEYERIWINNGDGSGIDLLYLPLGQFRTHPDATLTGTPTKYTIDGSTLFVAPTSDTTLQVSYWGALGAFTGDASTDAVLTAHPGVYLSGVLAEAYRWMRDPDGMTMETAEFAAKARGVNAQAKARATSGSMLVARPQSVA
jgi:hypothetical protein